MTLYKSFLFITIIIIITTFNSVNEHNMIAYLSNSWATYYTLDSVEEHTQ